MSFNGSLITCASSGEHAGRDTGGSGLSEPHCVLELGDRHNGRQISSGCDTDTWKAWSFMSSWSLSLSLVLIFALCEIWVRLVDWESCLWTRGQIISLISHPPVNGDLRLTVTIYCSQSDAIWFSRFFFFSSCFKCPDRGDCVVLVIWRKPNTLMMYGVKHAFKCKWPRLLKAWNCSSKWLQPKGFSRTNSYLVK